MWEVVKINNDCQMTSWNSDIAKRCHYGANVINLTKLNQNVKAKMWYTPKDFQDVQK